MPESQGWLVKAGVFRWLLHMRKQPSDELVYFIALCLLLLVG